MNIINEDSKRNLYSGIFWIVDLIDVYKNKDYCFTFEVDSNGNSLTDVELNSKNGRTYNHERVWSMLPPKMTNNKKFNYYPRGRVQIANGKATIYANPNICTQDVMDFIIDMFNLSGSNGITKIRIIPDGSDHYKCYLDED